MRKRYQLQAPKRAAYWTVVALPQPFLIVVVGALPALGLAVWNSFHLAVPARWLHLGVAILIAAAVGLFQVYGLPKLASVIVTQTGVPDHAGVSVVRLTLMVVVAIGILGITMGQLDGYRDRLFQGPPPTNRILLALVFIIVSFTVAILTPVEIGTSEVGSVVASSLSWWVIR